MALPLLSALWRANRLPLIGVIFLLIANAALFAWIGYVLSPRVDNLEHRYIETENLLHRSVQEGAPRSAREHYRQVAADLETFRQAIPERDQFTSFLKELFALAGDAGLSLERIAYSPKEIEERGLLSYGLTFSEGGDYRQIKKFIYALEQSPRIIAIEAISLAGGDQAGSGGVKLSIRLTTYFRSEPR